MSSLQIKDLTPISIPSFINEHRFTLIGGARRESTGTADADEEIELSRSSVEFKLTWMENDRT
jgi:hypothetical protein